MIVGFILLVDFITYYMYEIMNKKKTFKKRLAQYYFFKIKITKTLIFENVKLKENVFSLILGSCSR